METCAEIPLSAQLTRESLPPDRTEAVHFLIQLSGVRQHEGIRAEVGSRRDSRTRWSIGQSLFQQTALCVAAELIPRRGGSDAGRLIRRQRPVGFSPVWIHSSLKSRSPTIVRMDISKGFQIEKPEIFIPWKVSEEKLESLFHGQQLRHVTDGYFTTHCTSLGGLRHELGFHFQPQRRGVLSELEFFSNSHLDHASSYRDFQQHLEQSFGQPTKTTPGSEGFPSHTWLLPGAEEQVRIKTR